MGRWEHEWKLKIKKQLIKVGRGTLSPISKIDSLYEESNTPQSPKKMIVYTDKTHSLCFSLIKAFSFFTLIYSLPFSTLFPPPNFLLKIINLSFFVRFIIIIL